jgi:hypothetical protein
MEKFLSSDYAQGAWGFLGIVIGSILTSVFALIKIHLETLVSRLDFKYC